MLTISTADWEDCMASKSLMESARWRSKGLVTLRHLPVVCRCDQQFFYLHPARIIDYSCTHRQLKMISIMLWVWAYHTGLQLMYCISTCSGSLHNITAFHSTYNNGVSQNQTCRSCIGGGLGACPPRKIQNFRHSETVSRVILQALQQSPVHCCSWGTKVAAQLGLEGLPVLESTDVPSSAPK